MAEDDELKAVLETMIAQTDGDSLARVARDIAAMRTAIREGRACCLCAKETGPMVPAGFYDGVQLVRHENDEDCC
jgi:hypothetical protein